MKFIDISEHQGTIDWNLVKNSIDGVIIRAGYGQNHIDKQFIKNITECNRLEIPCGAYWFSYAYNPELAKKEAEYLVEAVKPYRVELPLAYDFEYDSVDNAKKKGVTVNKTLASDMARAFCDTIEKNNYYVINYANPDYLTNYFDEDVQTRFGLWLAQWPTIVLSTKKPPRKCQLWQYSCKGKINGIKTNVDLNESYIDFKTVIEENKLNNLESKALDWARAQNLIDDSKPLNWETIAEVIYKLHKSS